MSEANIPDQHMPNSTSEETSDNPDPSKDNNDSNLGKRKREEYENNQTNGNELNIQPEEGEGEGDSNITPYDPMELISNPLDEEDTYKRFKSTEEEEFDNDSMVQQIPPETVYTMELNDTNSIKLKKGNLVVRKIKEGVEELHELQTLKGYKMLEPQTETK